ncbi:MAG TPA: ABC transporter permease, partial [Pirellulaceae bacterium]|nr:ABC transporter permease [Pirellulaceae bacterium]
YMSLEGLCELLGEGATVSGAFVMVDQDQVPALHSRLKQTPRVAGVTVKGAALESFQETIAKNLLTMRTFNVMFAVVIAFGVVYNSARISLSEQSRDLATLRVMGYTRFETAAILLGELAVLTCTAIPVGCLIGYGLAAILILGLDTEVYRIPLIIERGTYVFAAIVVLIAAVVSGLVVLRRIQHLDLIGVLKTRE